MVQISNSDRDAIVRLLAAFRVLLNNVPDKTVAQWNQHRVAGLLVRKLNRKPKIKTT